jgi:hypothetical protein
MLAEEVRVESAWDVAETVTLKGNVPVVGAIYSPLESMVPAF